MAGMGNSGIYEIVNLVNDKRYVGSAVDFRLRWRAHLFHLTRGTHHSRHFQASWVKYGAASFEFRVLTLCDRPALIAEEQAEFNRRKPDYNVLPRAGSPLGRKLSEATRAKIAASKIGNKHTLGYRHSPESLARLSAAKIGNTYTKGKPRNPEAAAKTAAAHRGMKRSNETKAKISAAAKGRKRPPRTDETRAKLSAALKGRAKSPEQMAALQAGRARRVFTEEQRKAIGAVSKAAWDRRKAAKALT